MHTAASYYDQADIEGVGEMLAQVTQKLCNDGQDNIALRAAKE